jgi:hypothetical protein
VLLTIGLAQILPALLESVLPIIGEAPFGAFRITAPSLFTSSSLRACRAR